ncbi:MAG: hypothetical protein CMH30_08275 [Micavibrio sp.]|nr:hypothetical protein [Micavibrio sp.]|tara:strand:+ start:2872 stop:3402 length:531 start_codon:yes stop_codon:yes gene_type:complete
MKRIFTLTTVLALGLSVTACAPAARLDYKGEFWQRTDASSSIYLRGPKAQHTLNHDIANCVVEVREIERLGSLRNATPPNTTTPRSDSASLSGQTAGYDTPQYDSSTYAAYFDYQDMEGCMNYKGWQRVRYVPADVERESKRTFMDAIYTDREKKIQRGYDNDTTPPQTDYSDLNE